MSTDNSMPLSKLFVVSGIAGAGKTTTVRHLAFALRSFGYDVLCADFDLRTPTLAHTFGIPLVQHTVQDVLLDRKTLGQCIYETPSGIKLLLSGLAPLATPHPEKLIDPLSKLADIILIDAPAWDSRLASYPHIIVTQADFPAALNTRKLAQTVNAKHFIINNNYQDHTQLTETTISEILGLTALGTVDHSPDIRQSMHRGFSIIETKPQHPASESYKAIAARLLGIPYVPSLRKETLLTKLGIFR